MENIFSNLIIPRINLNSEESLVSAVSLIRDYGFDSFILFATDKVAFGERERFTLNRLSETRKILDSVSEKKVLFFLDAENGLGRRCIDGNEYNYEDIDSLNHKSIINIFDSINKELHLNQISFNLGPVLDLKRDDSKVLEGRCFSDKPNEIVRIGALFLESCRKNNIFSCVKHFPGHGAVATDTHEILPKSSVSEIDLKSKHIKPFAELVQNADLVMMNHINYSSIDSSFIPASMSKNIMMNILIKELHFDGIIISDSIRMESITQNFNEFDTVQGLLVNGGDLVLDPLDPIICMEAITDLYPKYGNEIDKKLEKIVNIKDMARSSIV